MASALAAELQALLEGVTLPARKSELVAYAREHVADARMLRPLAAIPDREYGDLDEVGEVLAPVQPKPQQKSSKTPHVESGEPPGGDDYTRLPTDTGKVRDAT
jgi:uncharacterized protein DUF2795